MSDEMIKAAQEYANNRRHGSKPLGRDAHREARNAFEAGARWQAAQRQDGEAVAKEAHTIACMFSSYARDSLKERGCTDEQLDNWFRILDRALKSAPRPAVPDGWKLVPLEPTKGMLNKAADNLCGQFGINYVAPKEDFAKAVYREFVEAAYEPPEDAT